MRPTSVLATVTGRDRPGVTASFFAALAAHDVDVRDVEQVVIRDRLILAVLVRPARRHSLAAQLGDPAAGALGMECEVAVAERRRRRPAQRLGRTQPRDRARPPAAPRRARATWLSASPTPAATSRSVTQLSTEPVAALEMIVRTADPVSLRGDSGPGGRGHRRRHRRRAGGLAAPGQAARRPRRRFDADPRTRRSTSSPSGPASADEVARDHRGRDGRRTRLRRVAARAGRPARRAAGVDVRAEVRDDAATDARGARPSCVRCAGLGYHVGVVSGGFTFVTTRFVAELGLDFAAANELEIVDGVLTGRVLGPIVDRGRQGRGAVTVRREVRRPVEPDGRGGRRRERHRHARGAPGWGSPSTPRRRYARRRTPQ